MQMIIFSPAFKGLVCKAQLTYSTVSFLKLVTTQQQSTDAKTL